MKKSPFIQLHQRALEPDFFQGLRRAVAALGRENWRKTYQTTFWCSASELRHPRCLPEAAAQRLVGRLPTRVAGVEWWLSRMLTSDVQVDFHVDRDNHLHDRTGEERHPRWSSVLYLNRCRGGLLAITDAPPEPTHPCLAPNTRDFAFIRPWPNHFVVFDGTLTHGVLDDRNQIPTGRRPPQSSPRMALVLNWWQRQPEGIRRWNPKDVYSTLALE